MNKRPNSVFYIITAVTIFILYLFLQPKFSSIMFGIKKTAMLNNFVNKTMREKRVNVQEFWKMREFYCPGSLVFDKTKNPFLTYSCSWLKSEDYLIDKPESQTLQIYKANGNLIIRFTVSSEEMKKAIGYFDYNEKDKEFVKDKYWMDITLISQK